MLRNYDDIPLQDFLNRSFRFPYLMEKRYTLNDQRPILFVLMCTSVRVDYQIGEPS